MGELGGFLQLHRVNGARSARSQERVRDFKEYQRVAARRGAARAGRALHGLRHAVLPLGLPARQPDPGLERPRLPRPLEGRDRRPPRRPTTSRSSPAASARRRARRPACSTSTTTPVTIKQIEQSIIDRAFEEGWVKPRPPAVRTGKKVAVDRLRPRRPGRCGRAEPVRPRGHACSSATTASAACCATASRTSSSTSRWCSGGVDILEAEGIEFRTGVEVGVDIDAPRAARAVRRDRDRHRARPCPRDLPVPGRELDGVHFAMEYLEQRNRFVAGETPRRRRRSAPPASTS